MSGTSGSMVPFGWAIEARDAIHGHQSGWVDKRNCFVRTFQIVIMTSGHGLSLEYEPGIK